jgi:hypothetical protein
MHLLYLCLTTVTISAVRTRINVAAGIPVMAKVLGNFEPDSYFFDEDASVPPVSEIPSGCTHSSFNTFSCPHIKSPLLFKVRLKFATNRSVLNKAKLYLGG